MLTKTLATGLFALTLVACGGKAENDSDPGTGGSGATAAGGAATGGTSSFGGSSSGGASSGGAPAGGTSAGGTSAGGTSAGGSSSGGASTGGAPSGGTGGGECVPKGDGWGGGQSCDDLNVMDVSDPSVSDADADGSVSPGEKFTVHASLNEIAGEGFGMYPGVHFYSDNPAVTVKEDDWFYGIFACQSYEVSASGEVAASVPSGTVVTITARVGMINDECPNAPAIQIPITIQ